MPILKYALPNDWRARYLAASEARAIGRCETTPNRGQIPDSAVHVCGSGELGEYWCMDEAVASLIYAVRKACPLLRSGSCEQQRQHAIAAGALRTRGMFDDARGKDPTIVAGWLFLSIGLDDAGKPHAHHTGVVGMFDDSGAIITNGPRGGFLTIEGNAADPTDAASRNGDGKYRGRERGHALDVTNYQFIDLAALSAFFNAN